MRYMFAFFCLAASFAFTEREAGAFCLETTDDHVTVSGIAGTEKTEHQLDRGHARPAHGVYGVRCIVRTKDTSIVPAQRRGGRQRLDLEHTA